MYSLTHNKAPNRVPANHSLFTLYTDDGEFDSLAGKSDDELIQLAQGQMETYYPEVRGAFLFGHVGRYAKAGYRGAPGFFKKMAKLLATSPADSRIHLAGDIYGAGSMESAVTWGERAVGRVISRDCAE